MNRAGYPLTNFLANDFRSQIDRYLPSWHRQQFLADGSDGRQALRGFLNSFPDHTAFLAQWVREERSGHVALVVKESANRFGIYQAQMGLSVPRYKSVSIEGLLYSPNEYGDRSDLRLFFE